MESEVLLELVTPNGTTTGTMEKLAAHRAPGILHRAFSVFLFDQYGRMLLQRRAETKYHSPGVWSNACCGHPAPAEAPFVAAARRTFEELGAAPISLSTAGTVTYRHVDQISGLIEHEYNHTFMGRIADDLHPNTEEVDRFAFVTPAELTQLRSSQNFSTWFATVFDNVRPKFGSFAGNGW